MALIRQKDHEILKPNKDIPTTKGIAKCKSITFVVDVQIGKLFFLLF
jgi:hypothetical protein